MKCIPLALILEYVRIDYTYIVYEYNGGSFTFKSLILTIILLNFLNDLDNHPFWNCPLSALGITLGKNNSIETVKIVQIDVIAGKGKSLSVWQV